jgi:hypothetical protein
MMFWLVVGILLLGGSYLGFRRTRAYNRRNSFGDWFGYGICMVFLWAAWLLPAVIVSANTYNTSLTAKNSSVLVEMKKAQRDELSAIVRTELSTDQYSQLMEAQPDADIRVILGTDVSALLIARSEQLVELNATVNSLVNEIATAQRGVCVAVQNPFMPQIPFGMPDCDL